MPTKRISDLFGDEEACDRVCRALARRRAGADGSRSSPPASRTSPARSRRRGSTSHGSRSASSPGTGSACAAARTSSASRSVVRPRRRGGDRGLRARLPVGEDVSQKKLRERGRRCSQLVRDAARPPSGRAPRRGSGSPLARDALVALHRPRSLAEAESGAHAPRVRRAPRPSARTRATTQGARAGAREPLAEPGAAHHRVPRGAPVRAHRRPAARDRRARRRPRADDAHAPAAPGRRRLGQDRRRAVRALRAVEAGRQAALMAPTEMLAEQHFLTIDVALPRLERRRRAPHELAARAGARARAAAHRVGRRATSWSARTRSSSRRSSSATSRLVVVDEQHRFGVASGAARRGRSAARPAHDRDADPAHARADGLRRPRRERARRAARQPKARDHALDHGGARVGGVHG